MKRNFAYLSPTRIKNRIIPMPTVPVPVPQPKESETIMTKLLHVDSSVLGALENRFQRRAVIGYDADDINFFGNEVLNRPDLLGRIGFGRDYHCGVYAKFLTGFEYAFLDVIEPRNAYFTDNANLWRIIGSPASYGTENR